MSATGNRSLAGTPSQEAFEGTFGPPAVGTLKGLSMWVSVIWELIKYGAVAWGLWWLVRLTSLWGTSRFLTAVLAVAAALRIGWLLYAPVDLLPGVDPALYHEAAINIMEGRGDMTDGKQTGWHAIGYKLTLSVLYRVFGPHVFVGQVTGVILGVLCVWLSFMVAEKLFDERVARGTIVIMAVFPGQVFHSALIGSELQAQALFLVVMYSGLRALEWRRPWPWLLLAGLCLGFAALTRPVAALLGPALVVIWCLKGLGWRRSVTAGAVVAATAVAVIVPWTVRNYSVFHTFVPISTQGGISLWLGANPYSHGDIINCPEMRPEQYELLQIEDEIERDREARRRALEYIRAHPLRWLGIAPAKVYFMYQKDEDGLYTSFTKYVDGKPAFHTWEYAIWVRVTNAYFGTVMVLFAAAVSYIAFGYGDRHKRLGMFAVLVVIFFHTLPHAVLFSMNRYNHTVMPLVAAGAAYALMTFPPAVRAFFVRLRHAT